MSSSKSSSRSASNVTDRRIGATDNAIVAAEGSTISVIDPGGVQLAEDALISNNILARQSLASNNQAIKEAAGVVNNAIGFAGDTVRDSLGFAGETVEESFTFGEKSVSAIEYTTDRSLDTVDEALEEFVNFAENTNLQAFSGVNTANKSLSDVSSHAISAAVDATRSDASIAFNNLVTYTALAGGAIAVALIIRGK